MIETILVLAGAVFGFVMMLLGRKQGEEKGERNVYNRMREDTANRTQAGRDAVRDGRGSQPDDRLRNNDGAW